MTLPPEIQVAWDAYLEGYDDPEILAPLIIAVQAGGRPPQYLVEEKESYLWPWSDSVTKSRTGTRSWSGARSGAWSRSGAKSRSWSGSWSRARARSGAWAETPSRSGVS